MEKKISATTSYEVCVQSQNSFTALTPKAIASKFTGLSNAVSLPVFRLGKTICARKSTLRAFVEEQERLSTAGLDEKAP